MKAGLISRPRSPATGACALHRRVGLTEAAAYEDELIRRAEPIERVFPVGLAHYAAGKVHVAKGEWGRARSSTDHAIEVFRTGNVTILLAEAVASSAWILAQLGDENEARGRLRDGEQLLGSRATRIRSYHDLGRAYLLLGELDEARRLGDRAAEASQSQPGDAAHALHLLGDLATHPHYFDAGRGEAHYRQALALAEPRGMRPLVAHCHAGLAKLYRRTGKRMESDAHCRTATSMYREMGMTYWVEEAKAQFQAQ